MNAVQFRRIAQTCQALIKPATYERIGSKQMAAQSPTIKPNFYWPRTLLISPKRQYPRIILGSGRDGLMAFGARQ